MKAVGTVLGTCMLAAGRACMSPALFKAICAQNAAWVISKICCTEPLAS